MTRFNDPCGNRAEAGLTRRQRRARGVSLLELLLCSALILTVSAIAIPNLLRARQAADEAGATVTLREINQAQHVHALLHPATGYAGNLRQLLDSDAAGRHAPADGLLSRALQCNEESCTGHGYTFLLTAGDRLPRSEYDLLALPNGRGEALHSSPRTGTARMRRERCMTLLAPAPGQRTASVCGRLAP